MRKLSLGIGAVAVIAVSSVLRRPERLRQASGGRAGRRVQRLSGDPGRPNGKVSFVVTNIGKIGHEFVVMKTNKPAGNLLKGNEANETGAIGEIGGVKAGKARTLDLPIVGGTTRSSATAGALQDRPVRRLLRPVDSSSQLVDRREEPQGGRPRRVPGFGTTRKRSDRVFLPPFSYRVEAAGIEPAQRLLSWCLAYGRRYPTDWVIRTVVRSSVSNLRSSVGGRGSRTVEAGRIRADGDGYVSQTKASQGGRKAV